MDWFALILPVCGFCFHFNLGFSDSHTGVLSDHMVSCERGSAASHREHIAFCIVIEAMLYSVNASLSQCIAARSLHRRCFYLFFSFHRPKAPPLSLPLLSHCCSFLPANLHHTTHRQEGGGRLGRQGVKKGNREGKSDCREGRRVKESITGIKGTDEGIDERRYSWRRGQVAQTLCVCVCGSGDRMARDSLRG